MVGRVAGAQQQLLGQLGQGAQQLAGQVGQRATQFVNQGATRIKELTGGGFAQEVNGRQSTKDMYHGLMRMHQHDWEAMRETAAQNLGHAPSAMWGGIPSDAFKGPAHHMMSVAKAHSPHVAAKLLEAEHAQVGEGGGFSEALLHVMKSLGSHFAGKAADAFTKHTGIDLSGLRGQSGQRGDFSEALSGITQNLIPGGTGFLTGEEFEGDQFFD